MLMALLHQCDGSGPNRAGLCLTVQCLASRILLNCEEKLWKIFVCWQQYKKLEGILGNFSLSLFK